ncbi:hypothetical protein KP509_16G049700 [Ceratopteris richardii]|nr:hypothetical protein KP509_16G049700 [Ceratopteris richardii]
MRTSIARSSNVLSSRPCSHAGFLDAEMVHELLYVLLNADGNRKDFRFDLRSHVMAAKNDKRCRIKSILPCGNICKVRWRSNRARSYMQGFHHRLRNARSYGQTRRRQTMNWNKFYRIVQTRDNHIGIKSRTNKFSGSVETCAGRNHPKLEVHARDFHASSRSSKSFSMSGQLEDLQQIIPGGPLLMDPACLFKETALYILALKMQVHSLSLLASNFSSTYQIT